MKAVNKEQTNKEQINIVCKMTVVYKIIILCSCNKIGRASCRERV